MAGLAHITATRHYDSRLPDPQRRRTSRIPPRISMERVLHAAALALVMIALIVAGAGAVVQPTRPEASAWTNMSVSPTGTLWEIASQHSVTGLSTSETVQLIKAQNGLTTSTLYAGQTLRVPTLVSPELAVAQR